MTQAVPTVQMLSSANGVNFEKNETIFAQCKKLCLSISLIVIGMLLILGSLALICMLPHFGILAPGLALLVVPVLVGLVLIALGIYELHKKCLLLAICHIKEVKLAEGLEPSKVPVTGLKKTALVEKKEKPALLPKPKVIPPPRAKMPFKPLRRTSRDFYKEVNSKRNMGEAVLQKVQLFEPKYP